MIIILFTIMLFYCGIMAFRFCRVYLLIKTKKPFPAFYPAKKNTSRHILILGDSSMYGAGVMNVKNTIGALIAEKRENASVEVLAENGAKVKDLANQLEKAKYTKYSFILIGVGANDIMQFSNFNSLKKNLTTFLQNVNKITDHIILCHNVNLGNTGFFLFPFNYIFDYRTKQLSEIYSKIQMHLPGLTYINFYRPRGNDFYTRSTRKKFLASDGAHPNDYATRFFFRLISQEINKVAVSV